MAYCDADMDAEQMPVVDRMDTEYTIYVNSLPIELNEDAIRDIFGQYGKIMGMFYPCNATWAYITYGTYREAELAIRELNNKKPLYLKVALAKERTFMREEQKSNISEVNLERAKVVNTADSPPIHNDIKYQSMGRGQSINIFRKHVMPQVAISNRNANYESSLSSFSKTHNVYEVEDPYMNSNKLWTRGVITVTSDGKRHVSLGRGYTLYEYPESYPKIEECISKVYEQRHNGLYEYSKDKFKNGVKSCFVCSTRTTKHCEKCHTYYCSRACQLEDWPQHQAKCERIPALVDEAVNSISSLQINQENEIKKTQDSSTLNVNKTVKSSDVKLRRPNTFNATRAKSLSNMSANVNKHKSNTDVTYNSVNNTEDRHVSQYDNDINVSQTKMADQSVVNTTNTKEFSQQHRLRRYNNIKEDTDPSKKYNGCSSTSSSTDQSGVENHSRNYSSDSNKTSFKEKYDNSNIRNRTYNNDRSHSSQRNSFQHDKNYNSRENTNGQRSTFNNTSVTNDLAFYKDTHLSKTKFITVEVIIQLDNDEYWVYKLENTDARMNLMIKLQDIANKSHNVQPIIGEVYGVMYETLWYRAMVTSLNPIEVHFIDFGNDEILEKNVQIKDIGDLIKSPKFARKIRLMQSTSDKYRNLQQGEKISVRMLSIDSEKTIIVEVEEEQNSTTVKNLSLHTESVSNNAVKNFIPQENSKATNKNIEASTIQVPSILDALADLLTEKAVSELLVEGFIQIYEATQKNVYNATFGPQVYRTEMEMIFNDLQEECTKIQTSADYKPKADELICGWNDGWYRGYISCPETSSKLSIITIDEARTLSVDKILPCPKKFLNICSFGVTCEINNSTIELQVGKIYEFTAVMNEKSYKQESLKIEIIVNSEVIQAIVSPWKVTNLSSLKELKNGSKICVTSYRSHYQMFARSLEEKEIEYYNNIMQSVAQYAQTAPRLTEPPVNQQVVIAPFEDGNSYRAMVLQTHNDKAKIVYIDFGNVAEIDIKDLKIMPQCHSQQQSCAAKVILKDVPRDVPMNQEVDIYLRNLSGKEVPLICTFEGASKDGVYLTMLTGECVNDKINQLLIPRWKKENSDDNTCYMLSDIKTASLGHVGDIMDALVLYIRKDNKMTYILSPFDIELITHIMEVMPTMLKEYCEKMEYYIPRMHELCLALYEEMWYRAMCINPKKSHTTSEILFIDYGNIETIEHKNIRLMPKDFIVPEAIANMCTVVNLAPVDSNGEYSEAVQKELEKLIQENMPIKIKIVEYEGEGNYKVELPDVRAALIKRGLVQSS